MANSKHIVTLPANTKHASFSTNARGELTIEIELHGEKTLAAKPAVESVNADQATASGYTISDRTRVNYIDQGGDIPIVSKRVQELRTAEGKKRVFRGVNAGLAQQVQRSGSVIVRRNWRLSNEKKLRKDLEKIGCTTVVERTFKTISSTGAEERFGNVYAVAL